MSWTIIIALKCPIQTNIDQYRPWVMWLLGNINITITHTQNLKKWHSDVQYKQCRLWITWLLVNTNHQAHAFYAHPITQQQHPIYIECGGWYLSTARSNAIVNRSSIQALVGEAMQLSTERSIHSITDCKQSQALIGMPRKSEWNNPRSIWNWTQDLLHTSRHSYC